MPADIAVNVVDEKNRKADHNGDIAKVGDTCQDPEDDENNVVGGIRQSEILTSSEGQIYCHKAGGNG